MFRDLFEGVGREVRRRDDAELAALEQSDEAVPRLRVDRGQRRDAVEDGLEAFAPRDHLENARLLGEAGRRAPCVR